MTILDHGKEQSIIAILHNKDWRANQQQRLLSDYRMDVVLGIKLNIPGKIKTNEEIQQIFTAGVKEIQRICRVADLPLVFWKQYLRRLTGPECFMVIAENVVLVKRQMIQFEEQFALGRLFDVDVLGQSVTNQLSRTDLGLPPRKCYVCGRPAKQCARNQTHSIDDLKSAIDQYYHEYFGAQS
ncbi:citrate lyase holo-[acyl-carrier protein] synthase [Bombilactobacillus folatiphilus]|uniref:citrate lyase holo-[acyl-carrier protein] synthase n=1 Tax=Bombilactobacillus folatiphilus TaxID=2923362 RepID=A0ABY4P8D6_9LACO|nr:citrate lyase holo-[acyl-carrier protein] synthase [Bombilactobacillus folatiphilus]UQS81927.1 citrate lyase holo-[acyl-carrier protein] synthase [Bombilactobacillus folatiphilus]